MRKVLHIFFTHSDSKRSFMTVHQNRKGEPQASRVMFEKGRPSGSVQDITIQVSTGAPGVAAQVLKVGCEQWDLLTDADLLPAFYRAVLDGKDHMPIITKAERINNPPQRRLAPH